VSAQEHPLVVPALLAMETMQVLAINALLELILRTLVIVAPLALEENIQLLELPVVQVTIPKSLTNVHPTFLGCGNDCSSCSSGSECGTCNSGYGNNDGVCTECTAGTYQSGSSCTSCETGTYSDPGQTSCSCKNLFEIHLFTLFLKACGTGCSTCASLSTCETCLAGYELSGTSCNQCATGTYSANAGDTCTTCGTGEYPDATQTTCECNSLFLFFVNNNHF